jgi:hypothetical protein
MTDPEPSVPLSAIRALAQQIEKVAQEMQEAGEGGLNDYYAAADCSLMVDWSKELRTALAELTALCPAPPEDQT